MARALRDHVGGASSRVRKTGWDPRGEPTAFAYLRFARGGWSWNPSQTLGQASPSDMRFVLRTSRASQSVGGSLLGQPGIEASGAWFCCLSSGCVSFWPVFLKPFEQGFHGAPMFGDLPGRAVLQASTEAAMADEGKTALVK